MGGGRRGGGRLDVGANIGPVCHFQPVKRWETDRCLIKTAVMFWMHQLGGIDPKSDRATCEARAVLSHRPSRLCLTSIVARITGITVNESTDLRRCARHRIDIHSGFHNPRFRQVWLTAYISTRPTMLL